MIQVNDKYGKLTVISLLLQYKQTQKSTRVLCQCSCGKKVLVSSRTLKAGKLNMCDDCFNKKIVNMRTRIRNANNMINQKFGHLTVIGRMPDFVKLRKINGIIKAVHDLMWLCVCDCKQHNQIIVRGTNSRNHQTQSCDCIRSQHALGIGLHDLVGQHFGYWTVLAFAGRKREPRGTWIVLWKCRCKCGTVKVLSAGSLTTGGTLSCGCHKLEVLRKKAKQGFGISKGEQFVMSYLKQHKIHYKTQVVFPNLLSKAKYPLSYDFYVPAYNLLIEYQGKQHYEPIPYFGGSKQFAIQQDNDFRKKQYAVMHHFKLLLIPYNDTHTQKINLLNEYLKQNG